MIGRNKYIQYRLSASIYIYIMVEAMKKSIADGSILSPTLGNEEFNQLVYAMISQCEINESLKRVESFQKLQAQIQEVAKRDNEALITSIINLSFDNLDHPLTTVAAISKSMIKKLMQNAGGDKLKALVGQVQQRALSKGGYKSRFLALNLMIDYIEPFAYLAEHSNAIREIIESTLETIVNGKYALNFLEAFLKKALSRSTHENEKKWFDIWIDEYLRALKSPNEALRDAVCATITPIVIKVNKNSLPLILSTLLSSSGTSQEGHGHLSMQILEQVITLLKIARLNKMITIDDDLTIANPSIRLEAKCQDALHALRPELPEFRLSQEVLMRLVLSEDFKTALSCIEIAASETKASLAVTRFELALCTRFIKHGLRTTFPEFRQKYIKAVKNFIIRLRTASDKDIKKYLASSDAIPSENLSCTIAFLKDILNFIEENLYLDKPVEGALPYFEILRIIIELFGNFEYKLRITQVYPPCHLLTKIGFFSDDSKSLFVFLINSMKSTWAQVRVYSYQILTRFPDDYPQLNDPTFVNDVLMTAASDLANNPKAMMAEASALFHNLLFSKCLRHLSFIPQASLPLMQLAFLKHIEGHLRERVKTFQTALIKEGKKEALLHGYLSFFKHLFEDFKLQKCETREEFLQWREFVKELLETTLQIGQVCKRLLSNNGLISEEGGDFEIQVDCRGHPIVDLGGGELEMEDYDNFILVGVWLAVKENGIMQLNLLKWLEFPVSQDDDTKFLIDSDIHNLQDNFLDLLFNFKHRGAIEKAAETFCLFCTKLLLSPDPYYRNLPGVMLDKALEKITTENLSTVLRRSAGIPPTIIAILRAEPISSEPLLLNKSIGFLLELAKTADRDDSKIHALNIMRFIFQDAMLRHDIQQFITPAMILATESFSSNNWSIRNSALMAFTSLTKRLLNNLHIQDQDLSRTRGLSVWEFLSKFNDLSEYFLSKLRDGLAPSKGKGKEDKEKDDLVIFSILLLISRLIPSFQLVDLSQSEESKQSDKPLKKSREASIQEYVELIKGYYGNATYFVRKISAQAILPLIKFEEYVSTEIPSYFKELIASLNEQKHLRQNQAHGLMVRINVFLSAYIKYRDVVTKQLGPGHHSDFEEHRKSEENQLIQSFEEFLGVLEKVEKVYSKVTVGLFVKTYTKLISNKADYLPHQSIIQAFKLRFEDIQLKWSSQVKQMSGDDQILAQEISRLLIVLSLRQNSEQKQDSALTFHVFSSIVSNFTENYSDFVYTFLGHFHRALKKTQVLSRLTTELCEYISLSGLPNLLQKDEKYCKVTEMLLKILHKTIKGNRDASICPEDKFASLQSTLSESLFVLMDRFAVNPSILSQVIKILSVIVLNTKNQAENGLIDGKTFDAFFLRMTGILAEYSPMQHKEQVRIAVSKALSKLLPLLTEQGKPKIGNDSERFAGYLQMLYSLIILLNDEQPDIRYYLCESPALAQVIDYQNTQPWKILDDGYTINLNDQFVIEQLFENYSERILAAGDDALSKRYAQEFLFNQWLVNNPYREHLVNNYEEKIFFFEPLNKFYDLLWVKRLAYKQLLKFAERGIPVTGTPDEDDVEGKLAEYYASANILKHDSNSLEVLAQKVMSKRVGGEVFIVPKDSEKYVRSLLE